MSHVRPIIRQFGSKTRVADQIIRLLPTDCKTWVDVFCGTAAVTLAKDRDLHKDEHVNDLNGDIVRLFRVIRDPETRDRLCDLVHFTPWSEAEYKACRSEQHTGDEVEDARRYLVRSWQGMAGSSVRHTSWISIDRSTKRRPRVWADLSDRIQIVAERFRFVALHEKAALEMLERFGVYQDAVLFCDPPYPAKSINSRSCYAVDMTDDEHAEFAKALREVKAAVVMTMAPGTIYDQVLEDWHQLPLYVRGLRNTRKEERIFLNYDPGRAGLFARAAE